MPGTSDRDKIIAARDELQKAADLLNSILNLEQTQQDAAEKLGMSPQNFSRKLENQFRPYVKTKMLTIGNLTEVLRMLRCPAERLLCMIFSIDDTQQNYVVQFPEYDEEMLWDAVYRLPARERLILTRLTGENGLPPQSLSEIARDMNLTVSRLGQLRDDALHRLRRPGALRLVFPMLRTGAPDCLKLIADSMRQAEQVCTMARSSWERRNQFELLTEAYDKNIPPAQLPPIPEPETPVLQHAPITLESINISRRGYNIAWRLGCTTLEELAAKTDIEILTARGLGRKTAEEYYALLKQYLGMERPGLLSPWQT